MKPLLACFVAACGAAPAKQPPPEPPPPVPMATAETAETPVVTSDSAERLANVVELEPPFEEPRPPGGQLRQIDPEPSRDTGPPGRINIASSSMRSDATLRKDVVLARFQAVYLNGVQRCYKVLLARNPTAKGRVALKLPINGSGRLIEPSATGFDGELDGCITSLMGFWVFAPPKGANQQPTEATLEIMLDLVPA